MFAVEQCVMFAVRGSISVFSPRLDFKSGSATARRAVVHVQGDSDEAADNELHVGWELQRVSPGPSGPSANEESISLPEGRHPNYGVPKIDETNSSLMEFEERFK